MNDPLANKLNSMDDVDRLDSSFVRFDWGFNFATHSYTVDNTIYIFDGQGDAWVQGGHQGVVQVKIIKIM